MFFYIPEGCRSMKRPLNWHYCGDEEMDTSSTEEPWFNISVTLPKDYTEYRVAQALWLYVSPILLVVGLFGNVLSLLVLRCTRMSRSRCSLLLSTLAVVDVLVLYTGLLRQWLIQLVQVDIRTLSDAGCKIHIFLTYYSSHLSSWTLLLVAVERMVSVCAPLQAQKWCSRRKMVIYWTLITVALAMLDSILLWIMGLIDYTYILNSGNKTITECAFKEEYQHLNYDVFYWIDFILLCLIPLIVILTCNTTIIVKVTCLRKKVNNHSSVSSRKVSSTTIMLTLVCVVFLLTTTPLAVYFLGYDVFFDETTAHGTSQIFLMYSVTNLIYYSSNAINFLLYCVGGSQFRRATKTVFCGQCSRGRKCQSTRKQDFVSTLKRQDLSSASLGQCSREAGKVNRQMEEDPVQHQSEGSTGSASEDMETHVNDLSEATAQVNHAFEFCDDFPPFKEQALEEGARICKSLPRVHTCDSGINMLSISGSIMAAEDLDVLQSGIVSSLETEVMVLYSEASRGLAGTEGNVSDSLQDVEDSQLPRTHTNQSTHTSRL